MNLPPFTKIYKFLPIVDHWATSGQPTAAQLMAIKAAGYDVVVNLALPDSPNALSGEAELVAALGLAWPSESSAKSEIKWSMFQDDATSRIG